MDSSQKELEREFLKQIPFKPDDYQLESFKKIAENKNNNNLLVVVPTGAGKTLVAEYIIWLSKKNNKRVIYTNPLKSLSTEKFNEWNKNYLNHCTVLRDTSDDLKTRSREKYELFDCLITTNERLNSILRKTTLYDLVFKDVDYLIIDEIHLLGSVGRGSTLEFIIMVIRQINPEIKIVGLSATLTNYQDFSNWLNSDLVYLPPDKRPIPLKHHFEKPINLTVVGGSQRMSVQDMTERKTIQLMNITNNHRGEQFLIFVSSRKRASGLPKRFFNLNKTPKSTNITLDELIDDGLAYHHAGLSNDERTKVEDLFKQGEIKLLFCTPTLAQGVNLPAKNVVLFDLSRYNILSGGNQLIYSYEVGQMSGRAGRRGYDKIGRCYYLGTVQEITFAKKSTYNPQPMYSKLYESIDEQILALNVIKLANTFSSVKETYEKSFLFHQDKSMLKMIPVEMRFLYENGFIDIKKHLRTTISTNYGEKTSKFYIKPRTASEILENIKRIPKDRDISELDIIKCFLCNGEYLSTIRVSKTDSEYIRQARLRLNTREDAMITIFDPNEKKYVKRNFKENLQKALGLIFADDLKIKVYGSKTEYTKIKMDASGFIERIRIPLSLRPEYQEKFSGIDYKIKQAGKMVMIGTLDHRKANLMCINKIGLKSYEILVKNNIDTVEKFLITNNEKLASILRWKEDTIERMKEDAIENMPLADL